MVYLSLPCMCVVQKSWEDCDLNISGRHLLAEYYACEKAILNDAVQLEQLLVLAAQAAGATVVQTVFHRFSPQGISGVVVVQESHLSIHTWPEHGYAAVDFYTCGKIEHLKAHEMLCKGLGAKRHEMMLIERGGLSDAPPFVIKCHQTHEMPPVMQSKT